jgi:putative hemin transport protein
MYLWGMDMQSLREAYEQLRARTPHLYLRDAAQELGVSEMALLSLDLGKSVFRLRPEWRPLLETLHQQGELMGLSRNSWAVIENTGLYPEPTFEGSVAVLHDSPPALDLRCYLHRWAHAFAVYTHRGNRSLYSIQIFTPWGESIHKVYFLGSDAAQKWEAVKTAFLHPEPGFDIEGIGPQPPAPTHAGPKDPEAFLQEWAQLEDTHDFFALLRRHQVSRLSAMQAAEGRFTWSLPRREWEYFLHWVQTTQTPIMFFVGNAGIHQIYTGPVHSITYERGWHNFHGPGLTLHFNPEGLGYIYLVKKPTREGDIYSLELFSPQGEEVLWVFGARKPGQAVPAAWMEFVESLRQAVA